MKTLVPSLINPGEILLEEFLRPMGLTQYRLAKDIGVPPRRINEIVRGQRAITADMASRLGRYFDMAPKFWLNLQSLCDRKIRQATRGLPSPRPPKDVAHDAAMGAWADSTFKHQAAERDNLIAALQNELAELEDKPRTDADARQAQAAHLSFGPALAAFPQTASS